MVRSALLALTLLISASCATTTHDRAAEGTRLISELREASGGAALDAPSGFHEIGTIALGGATATYETWGDFHQLRYASTRTRNGMSAMSGFDGRV